MLFQVSAQEVIKLAVRHTALSVGRCLWVAIAPVTGLPKCLHASLVQVFIPCGTPTVDRDAAVLDRINLLVARSLVRALFPMRTSACRALRP